MRTLDWRIHLAGDHFPRDAQDVDDVTWIGYGLDHGWGLLSKDRKIRYHANERDATARGAIFISSNGNLPTRVMARWFDASKQAIDEAVCSGEAGIWTVYEHEIRRRWSPG